MINRDKILNMPAGNKMDALIEIYVLGDDGTNATGKHYSTDIAAAWEVIEKLRTLYDVVIDLDDQLTSCKILQRVDDEWRREVVVEQIFESTPYAICRAALLAVLEE